jgi:integrase
MIFQQMGKLTIHTLRKSCGQNWADHLPMNVVKELMGHSNIATTQKFYTQADSDHKAKAARVIQRLINDADSANRSNETDAKMTPLTISRQIGGVK